MALHEHFQYFSQTIESEDHRSFPEREKSES